MKRTFSPLSPTHVHFWLSAILASSSTESIIRWNSPTFSSLRTSSSFSPPTCSTSYLMSTTTHTHPNKPCIQRSYQRSSFGSSKRYIVPNYIPFTFEFAIERFFLNIYNQPGTYESAHLLLDRLPSLPRMTCVAGDFNLHHTLWDTSRRS